MGIWKSANIKKAWYYLKRNGIRNTWYAARERMEQTKAEDYTFQQSSDRELTLQRQRAADMQVTFSILVPTFRTPEKYLRELLESVLAQSYPYFELLLADATEAENRSVEQIAESYQDARIHYLALTENRSISENTNEALKQAGGDYVGLLDHDDVLTPDALYEMACRIEEASRTGQVLKLLYSDEDKCDGDRTRYYEPNRKECFNLDLLLSNNYICHFTVVERRLFQSLQLRREYDGAQDYDLVLRVAGQLYDEERQGKGALEERIAHIPKVLYHWRCHSSSTAENPQSKLYAYEAGRRALQEFAKERGWAAQAEALKHVGFYRLRYHPGVLAVRRDLGAVGGRVLTGGIRGTRICGGRMDADGRVYYEGLPKQYSGDLHRAVLTQDAQALDIRCLQVREECRELFCQVTGVSYSVEERTGLFDWRKLPEDTDYRAISLRLSDHLRQAGWRLLWDPELTSHQKRKSL